MPTVIVLFILLLLLIGIIRTGVAIYNRASLSWSLSFVIASSFVMYWLSALVRGLSFAIPTAVMTSLIASAGFYLGLRIAEAMNLDEGLLQTTVVIFFTIGLVFIVNLLFP